MSAKSRIVVDIKATERERRLGGDPLVGNRGPVVFTMVSQKTLYRIIDERELEKILDSGYIRGGTFAVPAERRWGASWGEDISDVIQFGLNWKRSGRLRGRLFLAKLDAFDRKMFHIDPKLIIRDSGTDYETELDWNICNTALGCSVPDVKAEDVEWFTVEGTNVSNAKLYDLNPKYERPYPLDDGDRFIVVKGSSAEPRLKKGTEGQVAYVQEGSLVNLRVGREIVSTRPTSKIDWKKNEMTVGVGFFVKGQATLRKI